MLFRCECGGEIVATDQVEERLYDAHCVACLARYCIRFEPAAGGLFDAIVVGEREPFDGRVPPCRH